MRVLIVHRPTDRSVDGVRLDHFEPGQLYDVGNSVGALLLAEAWATPVADEDEDTGRADLVRGRYPADGEQLEIAFDFKRKRKARRKA